MNPKIGGLIDAGQVALIVDIEDLSTYGPGEIDAVECAAVEDKAVTASANILVALGKSI